MNVLRLVYFFFYAIACDVFYAITCDVPLKEIKDDEPAWVHLQQTSTVNILNKLLICKLFIQCHNPLQ